MIVCLPTACFARGGKRNDESSAVLLVLRLSRKIEAFPRQAIRNVLPDGSASKHRKEEYHFHIRSLTPPQTAENGRAVAVQATRHVGGH